MRRYVLLWVVAGVLLTASPLREPTSLAEDPVFYAFWAWLTGSLPDLHLQEVDVQDNPAWGF